MKSWVITITNALDGAGALKTLRFSQNAYIDSSNNNYIKRLLQPSVMDISPSDGGVLGIFGTKEVGEIKLINTDGALNYLLDYAIDGRQLVCAYMDGSTAVKSSTFTATGALFRGGEIIITVKSLQQTLDTDHPMIKYLGNNALPDGVEGVEADLKDKYKPKNFGKCFNVSPIFVNTSKLIYQACSRTGTTITAVRERNRASALTKGTDYASLADMQATAPAAGNYRCFQGYFRLGSTPVDDLTCDTSNSSNKAGDVLEAILTERSATLDATSKTLLNTVGDIGIYVSDLVSTQSLINKIAASCGAYVYLAADKLYAKLLTTDVTPTWTIHPSRVQKIERKATGLGKNGLPIYKVEINYDFIETVQSGLNAANIGAEAVARYSKQSRQVSVENASTLTRHPLAEALKVDSYLVNRADALAVANRLLDIVKVRRDPISLDLAFVEKGDFPGMPAFNIGDGVYITTTTAQLGYANKACVIIGYRQNANLNKVSLEVIG